MVVCTTTYPDVDVKQCHIVDMVGDIFKIRDRAGGGGR